MIYLDNSATTPLHPKVKDVIRDMLDHYGNPSSAYTAGRFVKSKVDASRQTIANFLNCEPTEIVFTGGASESNNTVLRSVLSCGACAVSGNECRGHVITSNIEHPSVSNTLKCLKRQHIDVTEIP